MDKDITISIILNDEQNDIYMKSEVWNFEMAEYQLGSIERAYNKKIKEINEHTDTTTDK